jgi:hypothetical protein
VTAEVTALVPVNETRPVGFVLPGSRVAFVRDGGRVVAAWTVTRWRRRLVRSIYWPLSEEWTRKPAREALVLAGVVGTGWRDV